MSRAGWTAFFAWRRPSAKPSAAVQRGLRRDWRVCSLRNRGTPGVEQHAHARSPCAALLARRHAARRHGIFSTKQRPDRGEGSTGPGTAARRLQQRGRRAVPLCAGAQAAVSGIMTIATMQQVYIVRHGETEWSKSGRHTGRDPTCPLTDTGRLQAEALGTLAERPPSDRVGESAGRGSARHCRLAGLADVAEVNDDLREMGSTASTKRRTYASTFERETPDWSVCDLADRGGESVEQAADRASASSTASSSRARRCGPVRARPTSCECSQRAGSACRPSSGRLFGLDLDGQRSAATNARSRVIGRWKMPAPIG